MFDQNWETISGETAEAIEVLNHLNQANVIEAIVRLFLHQDGGTGAPCSVVPTLEFLKELHRTGTLFLLEAPGAYRNTEVMVVRRDGRIYSPPPATHVGVRMDEFLAELRGLWLQLPPAAIAAYCLWRINWIHPFKNGNGRTARAYAYVAMCLRFGFVLPGVPTVPDLIMRNRDEYEAGLGHADATLVQTGKADIVPLMVFMDRLLREQLSSIDEPPAPAA